MARGKMAAAESEAERAFWGLAADLLERPGVTRSTMMGYPCLRYDGRFFAAFERRTGNLVVKLSQAEVAALLDAGDGKPFAPNGRVFREWAALSPERGARWAAILERACSFAGTVPLTR